MEDLSKSSDHIRKSPKKRRMIPLVTALAAAVSLLAGCYPKYDFSPDYEDGYSIIESGYSQSVTSDHTGSDSAVSSVTSSALSSSTASSGSVSSESTVSSAASSSSLSSLSPSSSVPHITGSSSAYNYSSAEPVTNTTPDYAPRRTKPLDTKSEEFVAYTTGNEELSFSRYYIPYLFDFRTRMTVGYSLHDYKNQLPVEADYGIMGMFNGSVISIKTYDHTGKGLTVVSSYLEPLDASSAAGKESVPFGPAALNNDARDLANGLYRISVTFSNGNTAELYFLVNGDEYLFCQMIMASTTAFVENYNIDKIRARRGHLKNLLKEWNVTPENSLSVDMIKYPFIDYYGLDGKQHWRCDTDLWAELSDTLVEPEWSDERKAYVICDWMSQNLAYDYYVSDVINEDRAIHNNDYMGKYSVWELKCGVCRDFGQILAIMLRQQGIPAEVIANDTHLWNIVYLNGKWMEADITLSMTKNVDGADPTVRSSSGNSYFGLLSMRGQNNNLYYGTSLHKFLYIGQNFAD